jgi:hypothetical protein
MHDAASTFGKSIISATGELKETLRTLSQPPSIDKTSQAGKYPPTPTTPTELLNIAKRKPKTTKVTKTTKAKTQLAKITKTTKSHKTKQKSKTA